MSENQPSQPSQAPQGKARNPVERILVYGLIIIGAVLIGVEARGKFAQEAAYNEIMEEFQKAVDNPKAEGVSENVVKKVLGGRAPIRSENFPASKDGTFAESKKLEVYSWFTLNPNQKRELYVFYARKGKQDAAGPCLVDSVSPTEEGVRPASVENPPKISPEDIKPRPRLMVPGARATPAGPEEDEKKPEETAGEEKPADNKKPDENKPEEKKPEPEAAKPEGDKPADPKSTEPKPE